MTANEFIDSEIGRDSMDKSSLNGKPTPWDWNRFIKAVRELMDQGVQLVDLNIRRDVEETSPDEMERPESGYKEFRLTGHEILTLELYRKPDWKE